MSVHNRQWYFLWWSPLVWTCLVRNWWQCCTRELGVLLKVKRLYSKLEMCSFWSSRAFFYLKSPGKIKPIAKQRASFCVEAMSLVNPKWPCRTVLSQQLCAARTQLFHQWRLSGLFHRGHGCFSFNWEITTFGDSILAAGSTHLSLWWWFCSNIIRMWQLLSPACRQTDAAYMLPA